MQRPRSGEILMIVLRYCIIVDMNVGNNVSLELPCQGGSNEVVTGYAFMSRKKSNLTKTASEI